MKRIYDVVLHAGKSKSYFRAATFHKVLKTEFSGTRIVVDAANPRYLPGKLHDIWVEYDGIFNIMRKAGGVDVTDVVTGYKFIKSSGWNSNSIVNSLKENATHYVVSKVVTDEPTGIDVNSTQFRGSYPVKDFSFFKAIQIGPFVFLFKIVIWRYVVSYKIDDNYSRSLFIVPKEISSIDGVTYYEDNTIADNDNDTLYHYYSNFMIADIKGETVYYGKRNPKNIGHNIFPFHVSLTQSDPELDPQQVFTIRKLSTRCIKTHNTIAFLYPEGVGSTSHRNDKFLVVSRANNANSLFLLTYSTIPYTWNTGIDLTTVNEAEDWVPEHFFADETGLVSYSNPSLNECDVTNYIKDDNILANIAGGKHVRAYGYVTYSVTGQYISKNYVFDRSGYEYYNTDFGICMPIIFEKANGVPVVFSEIYLGRFNASWDYETRRGIKIDKGKFFRLCGTKDRSSSSPIVNRYLFLKTEDVTIERDPIESFVWVDGHSEGSHDILESYYTWHKTDNNTIPEKWYALKIVVIHGGLNTFRVLDRNDLSSGGDILSLVGWADQIEYVDNFTITKNNNELSGITWSSGKRMEFVLGASSTEEIYNSRLADYDVLDFRNVPWSYDNALWYMDVELLDKWLVPSYPNDVLILTIQRRSTNSNDYGRVICKLMLPYELSEEIVITPDLIIENQSLIERVDSTSGLSKLTFVKKGEDYCLKGLTLLINSTSYNYFAWFSVARDTTGDIIKINETDTEEPNWSIYYRDIVEGA